MDSNAFCQAARPLRVPIQLPPGVNPAVGQRLELTQMDDRTVLVTVNAVTDTTLTLDANHPLAGIPLEFDITVVAINQDR